MRDYFHAHEHVLLVCKEHGDARTAQDVVALMEQATQDGIRILRPDSLIYENLVSAHLNSAVVRGVDRDTPAMRRARSRLREAEAASSSGALAESDVDIETTRSVLESDESIGFASNPDHDACVPDASAAAVAFSGASGMQWDSAARARLS